MSALAGDFDPQKVAQELRNQFSEYDVKKRDSQRRYQSYLGEAMEDGEGDFETYEHEPPPEFSTEGMSDEGLALVVDAEEAAQEAMATMFNARRTLQKPDKNSTL